ncbi:uncharacterized protein LOC129724653 [Wyeomyia smithii]|uniref:uncharacterized protein LOC129724653 n=1 Tax=Wyeomyia smithii TaxID=174621 RepID=UPI002467BAF5|nr:uncharacterized protein LOC129724653 [Wyeomyia smithii]
MGPTKMTPEDQQFNISFVAEVKKHPCLFNSSSTEYKQVQVQDKAWQAVSASVNESVDMCKKRWRNLRCCMTRYLKSVRDNTDNASNFRRKPYYLFNHMQFVIPYLKMKDGESATYESEDTIWLKSGNSGELLKHDEDEEDDEEGDQEVETIDVQEDDHQQIKQSIIKSIKILPMSQDQQTQETTTTTTTYEIFEATPSKQPRIEVVQSLAAVATPVASTPQVVKQKDPLNIKQFTYTVAAPQQTTTPLYTSTPVIPEQTVATCGFSTPRQQTQYSANTADADNNFFKSLIPDIQSMNMDQKRKLKIGILRLIDEILSST